MRTPMKARLRVPFLSLLALLGVTLMSACSGGITSPTSSSQQRSSLLTPTGRSNLTGYVVAERAPTDSLGTKIGNTLTGTPGAADSLGLSTGQ